MKTSRISILLALIGAFSIAPSGIEAQAQKQTAMPSHQFDEARNFIHKIMEKENLPSVSVAVAKGGKILWEEGFGWANREKMLPATPDTMYSAACSFTPDAIMELVEEGKIDLDKPINDYLGASKFTAPSGDASGATIRRVLSDTAGLGFYYRLAYQNDKSNLDQAVARYGLLMHQPGETWKFSSIGYEALGSVIERVSTEDYADYMRQHVYLPLGMTHTAEVSRPEIGPGFESYAAVRYDEKQRPMDFFVFGDHLSLASAYSSAHDLIRYAMFHMKNHLPDQKPILKDGTIDAMYKIEVRTGPSWSYGLGWMIEKDHGYDAVGFGGGMPGGITVVDFYPSDDVAVVVLINTGEEEVPVGDLIKEQIVSAVLPKYAAAVRAEENQRENPPPQAKQPAFVPSPELAGEWTGTLHTWQQNLPFSLLFKPDGDTHVRLGQRFETVVNKVKFKEGHLTGEFSGGIPTPDASRHPDAVQLDLKLTNGKFSGSAVARADDDDYALPSYVELTRNTK